MPVNEQVPDYDLDETVVVTAPGQLRALADPLRRTLLELLLERAATVTEMAQAAGRPKSTVAYHVNLLVATGLLRVVRTRTGTRARAPAPTPPGQHTPLPPPGGFTCKRRSPISSSPFTGSQHRDHRAEGRLLAHPVRQRLSLSVIRSRAQR